MEFEYNVVIPSLHAIVYMQDGDGSQLLIEDYEAGYNAYMDYEVIEGPQAGDGGIYMYDNTNVESWTDKIEKTIRYIFDIPDTDPCPSYQLKKNREEPAEMPDLSCYGTTVEEVLMHLSDAVNLADKNNETCLADNLMQTICILKDLWGIKE